MRFFCQRETDPVITLVLPMAGIHLCQIIARDKCAFMCVRERGVFIHTEKHSYPRRGHCMLDGLTNPHCAICVENFLSDDPKHSSRKSVSRNAVIKASRTKASPSPNRLGQGIFA